MPKKLASNRRFMLSGTSQNVSPPKDYAKWDEMITQFVKHLIDRYGIDEVSQWYFEVWNEPNIDFWTGDPKQATYFELYDHTARAIKSVNENCALAARQRHRRHGRTLSFGIVPKTMFPSISSHRTCMAMTKQKMCSAPTSKFPAIAWSAARSPKFISRSSPRRCPGCR